jgi:hypothetical protein
MLTASTVTPRGSISRRNRSIVEGNSLVQTGQEVIQK